MALIMANNDKMLVPLGSTKPLRDSRLGSSFIEHLCKKYPKACSLSLTNLAGFGLSLSHQQEEFRSSQQIFIPFARGLSSSQPDLLNAFRSAFHSDTLDTGGNALSYWEPTCRTFSLGSPNAILAKKKISASSKLHSAPTSAEKRLSETRAKMDTLSSRISEISRSNKQLEVAGAMSFHGDASSRACADGCEFDDSAPTEVHQPALKLSPKNIQLNRAESTEKTKRKIEALRETLTSKCNDLRCRRKAIFDRISSQTSVSAGFSPRRTSEAEPAAGSCVGISLQNKRSAHNPLTPKLNKYTTQRASGLSHATNQASVSKTANVSTQLSSLDQTQASKDGRLCKTEPCWPVLSIKKEKAVKCVRFCGGVDIIESATPRLRELQQLAELSASIQCDLPDTDITCIESISDTSSSDSQGSFIDLTDIDPRLAKVAFAHNFSSSLFEPSKCSGISTESDIIFPRLDSSSLAVERVHSPPKLSSVSRNKNEVDAKDTPVSLPKPVVQLMSSGRLKVNSSPVFSDRTTVAVTTSSLANSEITSSDKVPESSKDMNPETESTVERFLTPARPSQRHSGIVTANQVVMTTLSRCRSRSCDSLWGSNASLSLAESQSSLSERVASFKLAAKKRMKNFKRTLSLDRLGSSTSGSAELSPPSSLHKNAPDSHASTPYIKKSLPFRIPNKKIFSKK
ncbi:uncharacterized protein [Watersipora subatra]|uniref:uncharacterized protein isoform X2 n=1 Tax=Watersipora subatra TaxID=2589382 RepID=UPI00355BF6D4